MTRKGKGEPVDARFGHSRLAFARAYLKAARDEVALAGAVKALRDALGNQLPKAQENPAVPLRSSASAPTISPL